jgi:hypothetical protein
MITRRLTTDALVQRHTFIAMLPPNPAFERTRGSAVLLPVIGGRGPLNSDVSHRSRATADV